MSLQTINPDGIRAQEKVQSTEDWKGGIIMGSATIGGVVQHEKGSKQTAADWITDKIVRKKNPAFDLRLQYPKVMKICTGVTALLHVLIFTLFPTFKADGRKIERVQHVIEIQQLPETRQIKRPPPPPRPAVPVETESDDVPDDVTIETTDLAFDDTTIDLPPPPPPGSGDDKAVEEEIIEFWAVEKTPEIAKSVAPEYPEVARKAGLEGTVFVEFTVGRDGRVRDARVLRGPQIFHEAALAAVVKFVFKPALQNDKPVTVRMTQPIRFRLTGN